MSRVWLDCHSLLPLSGHDDETVGTWVSYWPPLSGPAR